MADPTRLIVCNIEPGSAELDSISSLPTSSLVLLVSGSPTMLTMATKLLAARRGEEIAVRSVLTSDEKELNYMINHADLIICGSTSDARFLPLAGKKRIVVFRLFSHTTIELIKERLAKWG